MSSYAMRPVISPLRLKDARFGRLQGVSRVYGRVPTGGSIGTSDTSIMFTANGPNAVNVLDNYTVIDRVMAFGTSKVSGAVGREAMVLTVTNGATPLVAYQFQSSTAFQSATEYTEMDRLDWKTDGLLVIPPGYFLNAKVSESTVRYAPFVTGYRVNAGVARALGINQLSGGAARNGFASDGSVLAASTGNRVCIPAVAGKAFRIRNIAIRGFAGSGSLESVTISFGDGSTFRTFIKLGTARISLGHKVDMRISNCTASGPLGYGVYVTFSSTNAAWSVNVLGEYINPNYPGDTNCGQVDPTGVFASPASSAGQYFWAHTGGGDTTADTGVPLFSTALGLQTFALFDGVVYGGQPDGSTGTPDGFGITSGATTGGVPAATLGGYLGDLAGTQFTNATTSEYNIAWDDLGGLPIADPRLQIRGYGANMDLTVWGRCVDKSAISGTGGIFNGTG